MRALRPPPGNAPRAGASPHVRAARPGEGGPSGGFHHQARRGRPAHAEAAVSVPCDSFRDHRATAEGGGSGRRFPRGATTGWPPARRPSADAPESGRAVSLSPTTLTAGRAAATVAVSAGRPVQGSRRAHSQEGRRRQRGRLHRLRRLAAFSGHPPVVGSGTCARPRGRSDLWGGLPDSVCFLQTAGGSAVRPVPWPSASRSSRAALRWAPSEPAAEGSPRVGGLRQPSARRNRALLGAHGRGAPDLPRPHLRDLPHHGQDGSLILSEDSTYAHSIR